MKKSLLIQALLAVASASNAHAALAPARLAPGPVMKQCSCCKASVSAFDVHHESQCRHLAQLKGEPFGDDEEI